MVVSASEDAGDHLVSAFNARQLRKDATRQRITEAAFEVFAAEGFLAASIEQIAKRAAVSRPTVYFHFPSKIDLANEVGLALAGKTEVIVMKLAAIPCEDRPRIRRWVREFSGNVGRNSTQVSVAVQANTADNSLAQDLVDVYGQWSRTIAVQVLGRGHKRLTAAVESLRFVLVSVDRYSYLTKVQEVDVDVKGFESAVVDLVQNCLRNLHASVVDAGGAARPK